MVNFKSVIGIFNCFYLYINAIQFSSDAVPQAIQDEKKEAQRNSRAEEFV